jgi:YVTN family beta-propeller protein
MQQRSRSLALVAPVLLAAAGVVAVAAHRKLHPTIRPDIADSTGRVTLPNGWRVTPAGRAIPLPGDMPLNMLFTADGKSLLVSTGGFHNHGVSVIDLSSETVTQSLDLHKIWNGLAIDPEGDDVYVGSGSYSDDSYTQALIKQGVDAGAAAKLSKPVYRLKVEDGRLILAAGIGIEGMGKGCFTAGMAAGKDDSLYVIDINADTVYKLAPSPRRVTAKAKVGYRPYAAVLSPDGATLAVSNWGDRSVSLLDAKTLAETARIREVGAHPSALRYGPDGRLYVACGGENRVAVLRGNQVIESISVALEPKAPIGSTPSALALTPDGKTLFIACADNNDVVVADVAHAGRSVVKGFIPTGWYPSALAVSPDGKKLYIGVGKGLKFRNNYPGAVAQQNTSADGRIKYDYIGNVLSGAVSVVDLPDAGQLAAYTRQVRANLPPASEAVAEPAQMAEARAAFGHIKHVLYIIRENRTYDQVFGDIPGGDGDPKLTMYGERITPNAHALARRTVLLDNIYCNGEVSEDGHEWCNAAYATDFKEKAWINSYSGRGEPDADERLSASPAGYLWDNCERHGLTYRSYGEFTGFTSSPNSKPVYSGYPSLKGHASLAWWELDRKEGARDYDYADVFIRELHEAEKTGDWPRYMVMSLGEDHTCGLRAGAFTPFSCVAANDQGLGKIVEAISHSKFWPETAIFVIEDDAQNGPDHVDAHRTEALVISPWVKSNVVDSTLYTTASMVHTIELILGLPPMTQFDAHATPLYNTFTTKPNMTPYDLLPARIDLAARNPKEGEPARVSALLDFSRHDAADPLVLNRLLWENAHPGVPMPAPVHSGILTR